MDFRFAKKFGYGTMMSQERLWKRSKRRRMNYLEAAIKILDETQRPLTYKQITAIATERNWIEHQNPDPGTVMNSLIMQDLKMKGTRSEFSRIGPGTYTLRRLVYGIEPEEEPKPAPRTQRRSRPGSETDKRPTSSGRSSRSATPAKPRSSSSRVTTPAPQPASRPQSSPSLWDLMETLGTLMGYKIAAVILPDNNTRCMGWQIGGNPELSFILWTPQGTDMEKGIADLLALNYHKVVVMVPDADQTAAESFLRGLAILDKTDLVPLGQLEEFVQTGIRYMEFYNRLCDCRPMGERKKFLRDLLPVKKR